MYFHRISCKTQDIPVYFFLFIYFLSHAWVTQQKRFETTNCFIYFYRISCNTQGIYIRTFFFFYIFLHTFLVGNTILCYPSTGTHHRLINSKGYILLMFAVQLIILSNQLFSSHTHTVKARFQLLSTSSSNQYYRNYVIGVFSPLFMLSNQLISSHTRSTHLFCGSIQHTLRESRSTSEQRQVRTLTLLAPCHHDDLNTQGPTE